MRYLTVIFSLILILSYSTSFAQQEDYRKSEKRNNKANQQEFEYNSDESGKKWDWSKARIGGNFAMSFRSGGLFIDASPTFGYNVHRIVEVGAGFKSLFYKQNNVRFDNSGATFNYKSFTYGPLAYTRVRVWEGVFVTAQYEMINKDRYNISSLDQLDDRVNVHHLLLGGGYSQPLGGAGNLNISLVYEVIDNPESIYQFGTFGEFPLFLNVSVGFGINKR